MMGKGMKGGPSMKGYGKGGGKPSAGGKPGTGGPMTPALGAGYKSGGKVKGKK